MKKTAMASGLIVILLLSISGFFVIPAALALADHDMGYWIHLDPVTDKLPGDSFFFSGTTNIPGGESIHVITGPTIIRPQRNENIIVWSREFTVIVQNGSGTVNTFITPEMAMVPSEIREGMLERIRPDDEYFVSAEYVKNISVSDGTTFTIRAPETRQNIPTSSNKSLSTGLPDTTQNKSPVSLIPVIAAIGIIGYYLCLRRKR